MPPKADMFSVELDVCFVPLADFSSRRQSVGAVDNGVSKCSRVRPPTLDRRHGGGAERPDGTFVHFVPYPTPLYDASGTLIGAVNMLIDISDRKRADLHAKGCS